MSDLDPDELPTLSQPTSPFIDVSRAPIYVARAPEQWTDAECRQYCAALESLLLDNPVRYAFVTDIRLLSRSSAVQRRMVAETEKRLAAHDRIYCAGVAIVAPSAFARAAVASVFYLQPPVYPYKLVSSFDFALAWAERQLYGEPPSDG